METSRVICCAQTKHAHCLLWSTRAYLWGRVTSVMNVMCISYVNVVFVLRLIGKFDSTGCDNPSLGGIFISGTSRRTKIGWKIWCVWEIENIKLQFGWGKGIGVIIWTIYRKVGKIENSWNWWKSGILLWLSLIPANPPTHYENLSSRHPIIKPGLNHPLYVVSAVVRGSKIPLLSLKFHQQAEHIFFPTSFRSKTYILPFFINTENSLFISKWFLWSVSPKLIICLLWHSIESYVAWTNSTIHFRAHPRIQRFRRYN